MDKNELLKLRLDGLTYQAIAEKAGISRQRVQQLLAPPKNIRNFVVEKYRGFCNECGIYVGNTGHVHHNNCSNGEDYNDIENLELLCISCHRQKHSSESRVITHKPRQLKFPKIKASQHNYQRDTVILPVRIKKSLISQLNERIARKGISRNSWMIWAINQGLRSHTKKNHNNHEPSQD